MSSMINWLENFFGWHLSFYIFSPSEKDEGINFNYSSVGLPGLWDFPWLAELDSDMKKGAFLVPDMTDP